MSYQLLKDLKKVRNLLQDEAHWTQGATQTVTIWNSKNKN